MSVPEEPPLARHIGAFFGHIVDAIVSDPNAPARVNVTKTVSEESRSDGVILRRTVIEEVVLPAGSTPTQESRGVDSPR